MSAPNVTAVPTSTDTQRPNFFINMGTGFNDPMTTAGTSTGFEIEGIKSLLLIDPLSGKARVFALEDDGLTPKSKPYAEGRVIPNPYGQRNDKRDADFVLGVVTAKGSAFDYMLWDHGTFYTAVLHSKLLTKGRKLSPQLSY